MVVAPKRQYQVEQLSKPRREVKPKAKAKPKPKLARRIKPVILVALGFMMAFLVVSRHATIAENHQQILELEKKLDQALKQSELLKLELAASEDLRRIEEVAKNQLHMDYPDQTQIQFVELPEDEGQQKQTEVAKHQETDIWDFILRLID
ncbi:cell division protein FtsL [Caldicoprobacter algeriensis]|uniref:cell division protein FtsL n=1 Tax=Caldicoprobacter algeriensis TaxID=699281 RepID=UPI00207AF393|nr:cell division protein FtsL [Caldicoprobacter algeriensis]MCM8899871.1 cell division protein FtsL [Caldicoprobacter algeriensis]